MWWIVFRPGSMSPGSSRARCCPGRVGLTLEAALEVGGSTLEIVLEVGRVEVLPNPDRTSR